MQIGIDYLGGINYIKTIERHHPKGIGIGGLCKASGWANGLKMLQKVLPTRHEDIPFVRMSGIWHDDHRFTEADIKPAVKQAVKLAQIAYDYPSIRFYYQPWLEGYTSKELVHDCVMECRRATKKAKMPLALTYVSAVAQNDPSIFNEAHHGSPQAKPYIYSYDGLSMYDTDTNRWNEQHKHADLFFLWCYQCNGKKDENDRSSRVYRRMFSEHWLKPRHIRYMMTRRPKI